jgi:hypothetical protein
MRLLSELGRGRLRDERGGIVIIGAILVGAFALLVSGALHVGNWYTHRRHLQLQTDAAAFAAGQRFALCATSDRDAALVQMQDVADNFGGFTATSFNQQVGTGTSYNGSVSRVYNSRPYPVGSSHLDDPDLIPTDPCSEPQMFDVKATETMIPRLFSFLPLGEVNAHSRIELKAINEMRGLLPLAVPDVRPTRVFAQLIDSAGVQIDEVELLRGSSTGNEQVWESAARSFSIPIGDLTVRIKLVGSNRDPATVTCGVLFTECYDTVHIRGWDDNATAPRVEDAWILAGDCIPDAYYADEDCSAGLQADIDLGAANPVLPTTRVWATVDGRGTYQLTPSGLGTGVIRWSVTSGLPLTDGPRNYSIGLKWNPGTPGATDKSFGAVHTGVVSTPGPLRLVQVVEGGSPGANSFPAGAATFVIRVTTLGALLLSQPTDPPIYLRLFNDSGSASQNQSLNCDRDSANMAEELKNGCSPYFIKNPDLACPGGSAADLWTIWYDDNEPLPCALIKTGASVGQISRGLNERIFGESNPGAGACSRSPVNWVRNVGFDGDAHPDDKRALPLIVTPLGTFSGRGGDQVPVIDFGYFYVTGYKGDPCQGVDPNQDRVPNNRGAYVRGHFIKFFPLDDVVPSDELCKFDSITPCVGVLTR